MLLSVFSHGKTHWAFYAAMASASFVLFYLMVKLGSSGSSAFLFAFVTTAVNFLGHVFVIVREKILSKPVRFRMLPATFMLALVTGVMVAFNDVSAVYMFQNGAPVSVAVPVFTIGNVFLTVLFGLIVFKEKLYWKRASGLVLIILSIGLLNV